MQFAEPDETQVCEIRIAISVALGQSTKVREVRGNVDGHPHDGDLARDVQGIVYRKALAGRATWL